MYSGGHDDVHFHVIVPGKDGETGVDNVGTVPAAVATYAAIDKLKPDLLINAGTSGGFKVSNHNRSLVGWLSCISSRVDGWKLSGGKFCNSHLTATRLNLSQHRQCGRCISRMKSKEAVDVRWLLGLCFSLQ